MSVKTQLKRLEHRKRCRGKHRHKSEGAAMAHVRSLKRLDEDVNVSAYRCPFCKKWHVGHG